MSGRPCQSCGARLIWTWTAKGKRMPLDAEPVSDGNVEIVEQNYRPDPDAVPAPLVRVLVGDEQALPGFDVAPRYKPHWATCPSADTHRRRK